MRNVSGESSRPSRIRILVATHGVDDESWEDWQAARQASAHASRIALQRVVRGDARDLNAVGLGYGETLRWFGPIDDADKRRLTIEYAAAVLDADGFFPTPSAPPELACRPAGAACGEPGSSTAAVTEGLVLLSHAETDLLALERARSELPADFPPVVGHSLLALSTADALFALFGARRSPRLLAIVRIHGTPSSVPGLADLIGLAHREGWGLVVISGVGGGAELLPRTSSITPELASNLTSYFMAGGVANVAQALRYAAVEYLGMAGAFAPPQPMPAHGLYHPDLLVTNAAEWASHRAPDRPTAIVLFYRAHVLSGNLQFVDAALRAVESRGFSAVGVFTSSLRDCDATGVPLALRLLPDSPDIDRRAADPSDLLRDPARDVECIGAGLESVGGRDARRSARMRRTRDHGTHLLQRRSSLRTRCGAIAARGGFRPPAVGAAQKIELREADRHRAQQFRRQGSANRRCGRLGHAGITAAMAHRHAGGRL